jgi:CubicO group peptidase (beta-lactamase class C family)
MFTRRYILSSLLAFYLPSLVAAQGTSTAPAVLGDGWAVAEPAEAGLDPDALATLVELIDAGVNFQKVHAVLIEHKGRLVFERYWPGEGRRPNGQPLGYVQHGLTTLHDIRSISKSVTSLLLGIALGRSADDALVRPIASFFPVKESLDGGLDAVTLHHVLTMTAGLAWNELIVPYDNDRNDFIRLINTNNPVGFVLAKEVRDPPGSRWNYNSGLTDLTAVVIENLTGKSLADYAGEMLFGPLGITDYEWWRPSAWPSDSFPNASAGLRMRARDLAKIGSVILHNGRCRGRQIVPEAWVAASTASHVDIH